MAQDEGRFGRINIPKRAWCCNERPKSPRQIVRSYFYVFLCVCPHKGTLSSLILPESNTEMMNLFLEQVSEEYKDFFIIMQVDQAGWHRSKELKIPKNIAFAYQPAYSPELNPVEHIWDDIREKETANIVFDTIAQAITAVSRGIRRLIANPKQLSSMTMFPHIKEVVLN